MKRSVWLIAGGVALIILVAGGAFMAGRLLSQQPQAAGSGNGMVMQSGQGGSEQHLSVNKMPAPELPQTPSDVQGVFVRREDNSVFIGTGAAQLMVQPGGAGQPGPQTSSHYNGPVVEVVTNQDTTIYRDTTPLPHQNIGEVQVQQTVASGSIDEIGQNSFVSVWGKKTGDRIVAQVLVYSQPAILNARPPAGK